MQSLASNGLTPLLIGDTKILSKQEIPMEKMLNEARAAYMIEAAAPGTTYDDACALWLRVLTIEQWMGE